MESIHAVVPTEFALTQENIRFEGTLPSIASGGTVENAYNGEIAVDLVGLDS